MATSSSQPLVLEYKQRRYDGGPEKEMIEQIERMHQRLSCPPGTTTVLPGGVTIVNMARPVHQVSSVVTAEPDELQPETPPLEEPPVHAPEASSTNSLFNIFITPIIELLWGVCGLCIATLVSWTLFRHALFKSPDFRHQRRLIQSQSWKVICNSVHALLASPSLAYRYFIPTCG